MENKKKQKKVKNCRYQVVQDGVLVYCGGVAVKETLRHQGLCIEHAEVVAQSLRLKDLNGES